MIFALIRNLVLRIMWACAALEYQTGEASPFVGEPFSE